MYGHTRSSRVIAVLTYVTTGISQALVNVQRLRGRQMPDGWKTLTLPIRWAEIQNAMLSKSGDPKCNPGKRALVGWGSKRHKTPKTLWGKRFTSVASRNQILNNQKKSEGGRT